MAQKVQVLLVDDLDGGEASETVSFALDGNNYEIDLSGKNATELRDSFAKYVGGGPQGRPLDELVRRPVRPGAAAAPAPRWTATRRPPSGPGRRSRPQGQRPRPDPGHDHRAVQPVRLSRPPAWAARCGGGRGPRSAGDSFPGAPPCPDHPRGRQRAQLGNCSPWAYARVERAAVPLSCAGDGRQTARHGGVRPANGAPPPPMGEGRRHWSRLKWEGHRGAEAREPVPDGALPRRGGNPPREGT